MTSETVEFKNPTGILLSEHGQTSPKRTWSCRILQSVFASLLLLPAMPLPVSGIIFYNTGDPEYNATAPTGSLENSGWDYQGNWVYFLGTPIASHFFITAKHVGGQIGDKFSRNGVDYTTTAFFDDPETDLRIWKVRERFPTYAQLYTQSDEVGKNLIVFGRGTQRGAEVKSGGLLGPEPKGWQWGAMDGRKRWGENQVQLSLGPDSEPDAFGNYPNLSTDPLLRSTFDKSSEPNECHLSAGDSGGGAFIKDGLVWKLAGINYAADAYYNLSDSGPGFAAAIFDQGGLYKLNDDETWDLRRDSVQDIPGAFYITRISARLAWINSIIAEPDLATPILLSSTEVEGPYAEESGATINTDNKTITLPPRGEIRFYRINAAAQLRIRSINLQDGRLVISYQ